MTNQSANRSDIAIHDKKRNYSDRSRYRKSRPTKDGRG